MKQETVQYFTEREEEFVDLLIEIGTKRNVARVLVYLMDVPKAASHDIERGAGMRQAEVSTATKCLMHLGWVKSHESPSPHKGHPVKIYELAKPATEILAFIEKQKMNELKKDLSRIRKLEKFSH